MVSCGLVYISEVFCSASDMVSMWTNLFIKIALYI